jgi:sortase (surface protein transpeptidase)
LIQVGVVCSAVPVSRGDGEIDMDEDIRSGGSPGSVLLGEPALAGPSSAMPGSAPPPTIPPSGIPPQRGPASWDIDADWWGPAWDVVTSAGRTEPVAGADLPPAAAADPPPPAAAPGMPLRAGQDPSWRQILSTTVTLWLSRRRGGSLARRPGVAPPGSRAGVPPHRTRLRLVSAVALSVGVLAAGVGVVGLIVANGSPASAQRLPARPSPVATPSGSPVTTTWQPAAQPVPKPVELTIPAIGVRAPVTTLGLNRDGTLQVPSSTTVVGWYTGSPSPGATGSAVIAGHVDSRSGPGVFFWLRNLRLGERIYVRRAGGTLAVFTVTRVQIYAKNAFPTAAVYGSVPDAELRLITCGGTFDDASGSYLSNVVVYARLGG